MSDQSRNDERLERMEAALQRIDITLASQHVSLDNHIRRTEILEAQMTPISQHVAIVGAIGKVVLGSGGMLGLLGLGLQVYRLLLGA